EARRVPRRDLREARVVDDRGGQLQRARLLVQRPEVLEVPRAEDDLPLPLRLPRLVPPPVPLPRLVPPPPPRRRPEGGVGDLHGPLPLGDREVLPEDEHLLVFHQYSSVAR